MREDTKILDFNNDFEQQLLNIDTTKDIPMKEPYRQYYFIKKSREKVKELEENAGRKLTACITTFGCQMNERDSEKLLAILKLVGYKIEDSEDADFVMFNTCTVRENANLKVYGHLGRIAHYKKRNPLLKVGLCGCMMQEDLVVENIKKNHKYVDLIFGTHNIYKFAELLYTCLTNEDMIIDIWKGTDEIIEDIPSERKYFFKAGINIMFGCDKYCSYCIVPYVRGKERSRACEDIIKEITELSKSGVKEIMLLGQNVNSYGRKRDDKVNFAQLLREVEKIEGIERIRFMTPHPKDFDDEVIEVMKNSKKICKQLHMPLQSGSNSILKAMHRYYTKESYLELIEKIRKAVPDIEFSTDIIVGFPGETEEDFQDTLEVVSKVKYNTAFTFIYSKRSGTPAATLENQVPKEVVNDRYDRLHNLVREISSERVKSKEGMIMPVLVEEYKEDDSLNLSGRLSDNTIVHFTGGKRLVGEIVDVKLTQACGFYFKGELI